MSSGKLSAITFFGILVPGAYLAGILVMAGGSVAELCGLAGHEHIIRFISQNTALFAGVFLFVAYLLGVLVRLFAPEWVDTLSKLYLVYVLRDKRDWVTDEFPYGKTLTTRLQESGMGKIPDLMSKLNSTYGHARNKEFFNYCKWFIDANDSALSRQVQEAEALVRFLSGTTFALLIALPLALSFLIAFIVYGTGANAALYGGLLTIDMIGLLMILRRFKHQRRREVIMVWSGVHLIVNGGTPSAVAHDRDRLCESVFFPACLEKDDSASVVERRWKMENAEGPNTMDQPVENLSSSGANEDLRRELIRVLSEEVNNNTKMVYTFRNRVTFTAWIGPFIVLGAFVVAAGKALPLQATNWWGISIPLFVITLCYLAWMPYVGAGIERQVWEQCNRLRALIVHLYNNPNYPPQSREYEDAIQHTVTRGYYAAVLPILVSAVAVAAIGFNLGGQVLPARQGQDVGTSQQNERAAEPKEKRTLSGTPAGGTGATAKPQPKTEPAKLSHGKNTPGHS